MTLAWPGSVFWDSPPPMRPASTVALGVSLLISLACCGMNPFGPKPHAITFEAVPDAIYDNSPVDLQLQVRDEQGKAIDGLTAQAVATPADVAVVTSTGELRCIGSGDALVTLSYQELRNSISVHCRLVASLGLPSELRLNLGKAVPLGEKPVDSAGKPVGDVLLSLASTDETVLKVDKGKLVPMAVGTATLKVQGAGQNVELPVTVVRQFITDSLALRDGEGMTWALPAGNYDVTVQVKAGDGSSNGTTITWMGTNCAAMPESQDLHQTCKVDVAASLIVTNPTTLGLGPQVVGLVNVYQVP